MAALLAALATTSPRAEEPSVGSTAGASSPQVGEGSPTAEPAPAPTPVPVRRPVTRVRVRAKAPDRVEALVKGLQLNEAQEAEVRRALKAQRDALRRLKSAPADPEVPRVAAIHAITSRTTDRIRAVLTDEQRKKYGQAMPGDLATGQGAPTVEEWMGALRARKE